MSTSAMLPRLRRPDITERWAEIQAASDLADAQILIREAIHAGTIRVVPAAAGRVRIIPGPAPSLGLDRGRPKRSA